MICCSRDRVLKKPHKALEVHQIKLCIFHTVSFHLVLWKQLILTPRLHFIYIAANLLITIKLPTIQNARGNENLLMIASLNPLACNQHVFYLYYSFFFFLPELFPISFNHFILVELYFILLCVGYLLSYMLN